MSRSGGSLPGIGTAAAFRMIDSDESGPAKDWDKDWDGEDDPDDEDDWDGDDLF